jgi:hypothetical protein
MDEYLIATAIRGDETETLIILPFCYFALMTHSTSLIGLTVLPVSRERRENKVQKSVTATRRSPVCSALLCRLRTGDFQVTTDFYDQKIVDVFVSGHR